MTENNKKPRKYDLVLGGNNPPPTDGLVLGGIEGVKNRLSSKSKNIRRQAIKDTINYGKEGEDLLYSILSKKQSNNLFAEVFQFLWNNGTHKRQKQLIKYLQSSQFAQTDTHKTGYKNANRLEINLKGIDLKGIDFSKTHLSDINFSNANFEDADFSCTRLTRINFSQTNLIRANFDRADLNNVCFEYANLNGANFSDSYFGIASFENANLSNAIFHHAQLRRVNFARANLIYTDFFNADLYGANFGYAQLQEINLEEARFNDDTFLDWDYHYHYYGNKTDEYYEGSCE